MKSVIALLLTALVASSNAFTTQRAFVSNRKVSSLSMAMERTYIMVSNTQMYFFYQWTELSKF